MLPPSPFLQLVPLRVDSALRRLEGAIWEEAGAVAVQAGEPRADDIGIGAARRTKMRRMAAPSSWGRLFDQRWFRVELPKASTGKEWLLWRDQAEATLYAGDEPIGGFDVAHRRHRLPQGSREFWIEAHCVQTAIWHPEAGGLSVQGSRFEGAALCHRNEEAWQAYHDLKCLFDAAQLLRRQEDPAAPAVPTPGCLQHPFGEHSPVVRRLYQALDEVIDALDTRGIVAAGKILRDWYVLLRENEPWMTGILCGHAHIDLVWLWPERIGERKTIHTFATVDGLMADYPEFRFTHSQPAAYEAVERLAPGLARRVAGRIRSGRWQPTGVLQVESDTLLPCGEALLRSFLIGQEGFVKLRGRGASLAWLPDVFGYSGCLPQMIRLAGAKYFFTTKLTWNFINRFPYSSFVWRGTDGSEVLAHVTQGGGYCAEATAAELRGAAWNHRQSGVHGEFLQPTGFGDGGGGPTMEMCERARRFDGLPGLPRVQWGGPEEFFERLESLRERLPVFQGECYLEGHRGTFTTHGAVKEAFRELERALQTAEAAASLTGKRKDFLSVWKRLCFAQFHDYIPGSGSWDVYREGLPELRRLAAETRRVIGRLLASKKGEPCLFNPHALPVEAWVDNPPSGTRVRVHLPPLSGMSMVEARRSALPAPEVRGREVSNGLVSFTLDDTGGISRLCFAGEDVPLRGRGGQFVFFRDQPSRFEAWDLDRHTLAGGEFCDSRAEISPFENGGCAGFRVARPLPHSGSMEARFFVESGSPLLHIEIGLDWQEPLGLLKLLMPTRFASAQARFGAPFGSVLRSQAPEGSVAEAMWEVPFSRWLAVFDEGERRGLFAVTENKYGATVRDGVIGLSLVRSPRVAGCDGLRFARPGNLSRVPDPDIYSDRGRHVIRLAFGAYHGNLPRNGHPAALAETLFTAPVSYDGLPRQSPLVGLQGGETLIPGAAVPLPGGDFLLRLHEVGGQRGQVAVTPSAGWRIRTCDANGVAKGNFRRSLSFGPHEILSLRFESISSKGSPQGK